MKIIRRLISGMSIEEFAERHDLAMEVVERRDLRDGFILRFMAYFQGVEVLERGMLVSITGNGNSEEEAVRDYARKISTKRLVVNAMSLTARREINAPRFIEK